MFKKLANLFFEEVEEDEIYEEEKIEFQKEKEVVEEKIDLNETIEVRVFNDEEIEPFVPKKEKSIFINTSENFHVKKKSEEKVEEEKEKVIEYDFSPIISPIRGVKKSDKNEYEVRESKRLKPTKPKKSEIGTIISPIFGHGKGKNQTFEDEVASIEEEIIVENEVFIETHENSEFKNLSLADILDEVDDLNVISEKDKIHYFIGIKGTGMAALANLLLDSNYQVMGNDTSDYVFTEEDLLERGVEIFDFDSNTIKDNMVVIIGNSFYDDHPDVMYAKSNKTIKTYTYPEFLGHFIKDYKSIAVSGSHGKTTTTSMISDMLHYSKAAAHLIGDGRGAADKDAEDIVIEACEYKRNFLNYKADYAVITNLEWDHVDYYKTYADYLLAFEEFANQIKDTVFIFGDDPHAHDLNIKTNVVYYGEGENNDLRAINITETSEYSSFDVIYKNEFIKNFKITRTGRHMIYNALAAIGVGIMLNISVSDMYDGLLEYQGAKRRFDVTEIGDSVVIDDYAHHPTELKVTLEAAKVKYPNKKIVAVYHPDRIKRLETFMDEFISALRIADESAICSAVDSDGFADVIDRSVLVDNLDNAILVDDDEASVSKLAYLSPAVYVFMGTKEMHNLKVGLIDYLKRIDF